MNKNIVASNMLAYSLSHALVDATCAATLFAIAALGQTGTQELFYFVVFYNVIAFSTQPIWGLLVDIFKVPVYAAVMGMLLVALSTLFLQFPFLAALIAGIGNALFHIGGGVTSLDLAPGKAALPGIFVAPGALGLTIGILIGKSGYFVAWPFILLLIGSALLILNVPRPEISAPRKLPGDLKWFEAVILLLLLSVAVRSMVGLSLVLPWKSDIGLLAALTGAVVLGKALGGILGDRFGWTTVAVSGLAVSAPLLAFFPQIPAVAILGTFLFNLSMPITLIGVAGMLPGRSGFAFGLTTLALIVGALPTFTQLRVLTSNQTFIFVAILISIVALYGGLQLYIRHFSDRILIQPYQTPHGEGQTRKVL